MSVQHLGYFQAISCNSCTASDEDTW